jgi:polyphosphate kinase
VFIGSADLMQRNLQARVEVTVPVADKNLKRQLIQVLETQLADNVKARILDSKMQNQLKKPETNEPSIRAQLLLHSQFATSL